MLKKSVPVKPLKDLSRNRQADRVKEIASLIQAGSAVKPSTDDVSKIFKAVCSSLDLESQECNKLTPMEDLKVCSASMTWYQRRNLKSTLIEVRSK